MNHNVMHKACLLCSRKMCLDPFHMHFDYNIIVLMDLKAMIRLFQNTGM